MRILITGASGQLGAYLIDHLVTTEHSIIAWSGTQSGQHSGVPFQPVDLANHRQIQDMLDEAQPEAIIHAAAISSAEAVRVDPDRARAINIDATQQISQWADREGCRLVFTSTDLVFDGSRSWNREDQPAHPLLAYGRTKLEAEPFVLALSTGIVARICLLFGPSRSVRPYFFDRAIAAIKRGETQAFFEDEFRTPLDLATAAQILVKLAESLLAGIYHVGGTERVSRYELMSRVVASLGLDSSLLRQSRSTDQTLAEPRPADVSLDTNKLVLNLPGLVRPSIEAAMAAISA